MARRRRSARAGSPVATDVRKAVTRIRYRLRSSEELGTRYGIPIERLARWRVRDRLPLPRPQFEFDGHRLWHLLHLVSWEINLLRQKREAAP